MESREDLIKNHYMARIAELTSQLQLADSKSVHFYSEVSGAAKIATSPYPFQSGHGSGSVLRLLGETSPPMCFLSSLSGSVMADGDQFVRHSSTFNLVSVRLHASFLGSCKRDDRFVQPFCGPMV